MNRDAPKWIRQAARVQNFGLCVLDCGRRADNAAHRLSAGRGGPLEHGNLLGLCGSGSHGCHWATENSNAVELAYRCGWLISQYPMGGPPTLTVLDRIRQTPALICTPLGRSWHLIGGDGMPRLADPDDVPNWMFPGRFDEAVGYLRELVGGTAA